MISCSKVFQIYFILLGFLFSIGVFYAENDRERLSCLFNSGFCMFVLEMIHNDEANVNDNNNVNDD